MDHDEKLYPERVTEELEDSVSGGIVIQLVCDLCKAKVAPGSLHQWHSLKICEACRNKIITKE